MSLQISHQDSLYTETQSSNGVVSNIHYIIKNTPFKMNLSVASASMNFLNGTLQCSLLYDLPDRKKVESVSTKPLEYVMTPSADGKSCSVQFRISVLSTQHHANFLVNCSLKKGQESLNVTSSPLKSCSKLEQIRRKIAEKDGKKNPPTKKKRARSDELLETLQQIREAQNQQADMIANLSATMQDRTSPPASPPSSITLDNALDQLLSVLSSLDEDERPRKMRKITSKLSEDKVKLLADLGSLITPPSQSPNVDQDKEVIMSPNFQSGATMVQGNEMLVKPEYFNPEHLTDPLFFLDPAQSNVDLVQALQNGNCAADHSSSCGSGCLYQKELEIWNNYMLHSFLLDEDRSAQ